MARARWDRAENPGWGGSRGLIRRADRGGMNRRAAPTTARSRGDREAAGGVVRQRGRAEAARAGWWNKKGPGNSDMRMKSLDHRGHGNLGIPRGSGSIGNLVQELRCRRRSFGREWHSARLLPHEHLRNRSAKEKVSLNPPTSRTSVKESRKNKRPTASRPVQDQQRK